MYPFNQTDVVISKVGFDVLYGTNRALVTYLGEIPYVNTRKEDGTTFTGLGKFPYMSDSPSIIDGFDYWGNTGVKSTESQDTKDKVNAVDKTSLESVNAESIKSLRLYALSNSNHDWFGNFFYWLASNLIGITTMFYSLIIVVKSIELKVIMDTLNLNEVGKFITETFAYSIDSNGQVKMSPLMILSLVLLFCSICSLTYRFLKGKTSGGLKELFTEIIVVMFVGFILINVGNTNKTESIGSSISNILTTVLSRANPNVSETGIFATTVSGTNNNTEVMNYTIQMSAINKTYIDVQLSTQFGVNSIDDLNLSNFTDDESIKKTLVDDLTMIDENLGYYFWFANSGARDLVNNSVPTISNNQQQKLSKMITFLQKSYNKALDEGNVDRQEKIKKIILSLSQPSVWWGFAKMILLFVIFTYLIIVTFKYGIKVALGKLLLLFSILGLPVAGVLILSGNKKMVESGKSIIGLTIVAILQITVFSVFFDVILFVVSSILTNNLVSMLITFIALLLFNKFNPIIMERLNKFVKSNSSKLSPMYNDMINKSRAIWGNTSRNMKDYLNTPDKVLGVDENGNAILGVGRFKRFASRAVAQIDNAVNTTAVNRQSMRKVDKQEKLRQTNLQNNAEDRVNRANKFIADKAIKEVEGSVRLQQQYMLSDIVGEDNDGKITYNLSNLTGKELELHNNIGMMEQRLESIKNSEGYKRLLSKEKISSLTKEEEERLSKYREKENSALLELSKNREDLNTSIKDRVTNKIIGDNQNNLDKVYSDKQQELDKLFEEYKEKGKVPTRDMLKEKILLDKKQKELANQKDVTNVSLDSEENLIIDKRINEHNDSNNGKKISNVNKDNKKSNSENLVKDIKEEITKKWEEKPIETKPSISINSKKEDSIIKEYQQSRTVKREVNSEANSIREPIKKDATKPNKKERVIDNKKPSDKENSFMKGIINPNVDNSVSKEVGTFKLDLNKSKEDLPKKVKRKRRQ